MITASAPGKCILFGEHAVVYGYPAIAVSLDMHSYCTIEKLDDTSNIAFNFLDYGIEFDINALSNCNSQFPLDFIQFYEGMKAISNQNNLSIKNVKIRLYSDIWKGSGLGSSASVAIAFVNALQTWYKLNLSIEEINNYGYLMEKYVHGTPSGIDNSICSYGGIIVYQKGIQERILTSKFPILVTFSGELHNTGQIVKSLHHKQPFLIKPFQEIGKIVEKGIYALKEKDYKKLGSLCNENQDILVEIGLSTHKIDEIVSISKDNGAFGAKLTGAGVGGSVITLGTFNRLQKIQNILQKKGYLSRICHIDYNGMKLDSK